MILTVPELPIAIRDPDIFEYPEAMVIRPIAGEHIQWRVQSQQAPPGSPSPSGSAPSEQQAGASRLPGATEPLGMQTVRLDRPATGGTSISIGTDAPVDIEVSGAAVPGGRRIIRGGTGESLDLQGLRPGERLTVTLVPREAWQGVDGGWTVTRPDGSVGGETEVVSTEPSFELIVPLPTGASRDASVYENPAAFIYRPVSRDQLSQFPR
jgi:hypothetical protein